MHKNHICSLNKSSHNYAALISHAEHSDVRSFPRERKDIASITILDLDEKDDRHTVPFHVDQTLASCNMEGHRTPQDWTASTITEVTYATAS